jgi:signal transduction histidine kinase
MTAAQPGGVLPVSVTGGIGGRMRDAPIRRKLIFITMATTAAALGLAGGAIVICDSFLFRGYLARDLSALARITADNCTAALQFEDPQAASDVLHALRAKPHLVSACIFRNNDTVLATYFRPGAENRCPVMNFRDDMRFGSADVTLSRPVVFRNRTIGSLSLLYDLNEIGERMRLYGATVLLVLFASSFIAFLLSSRLRAIITTPVSHLVRATTAVSRTGDYSIRAQRLSGDELGVLTDAFNEMLSRIQSRDRELMQALAAREEANEKLARSNEDLERFAFVASHDLQEPLRMITLFSQLLVRSYTGDAATEAGGYVRNIVAGTKRIRNLLSDLLAYTDIGASSTSVAHPVDLNRTLRQVLENLRAAIDESGATITVEHLPALRVHEAHFVSVFQNLISNSLKYRGERPPEIHLGYEIRDGWLRFSVSDNGIGIDPEYHAKIFVAFKRLHGHNIAGTGIGLAICQRVVDRYKGRIRVESEVGRGATFIFTLPLHLLAGDLPAEEESSSAEEFGGK